MIKDTIINHLSQRIESGELSNNDLVEIIKLIGGDYLNLKTIPKFAADNKMSYPGAAKQKSRVDLFGVKFIICND